jgi:hypothetical protein
MTTLTYPTQSSIGIVLGIISMALAMLALALVLSLSTAAPALVEEPAAAPAPMTNQANSDDATPNSGILEFAD